MPMVVSAMENASLSLRNRRGTKTVSKPRLTVSRPLRYCHLDRLLLEVREQPDTSVMAGKAWFIKALAGRVDVRGPQKTRLMAPRAGLEDRLQPSENSLFF